MSQDTPLFEDDTLDFMDESTDGEGGGSEELLWKILIVDDEEEIHNVTKMALSDYSYQGYRVEFLSAYSGKEAKEMVNQYPDIAVMLLDVVMEDDHAGLEVARYIREEMQNDSVRIILRTGQPGQAPEKQVILDYDINDYKTKTELTAQKLFTVVTASLRSYNHILKLEKNKKGLEKIIEASSAIFEIQSVENFIQGVLRQIASLFNMHEDSLYAHSTVSSMMVGVVHEGMKVISGIGKYSDHSHRRVEESLPDQVKQDLGEASRQKKSIFFKDRVVIYFCSKSGEENMLYLEGDADLDHFDVMMLELFCRNINIAFDNIYFNHELLSSQKEMIHTIGLIAERKTKEQSNEVNRIGEYASWLGEKYGLDERQLIAIKDAAPMHDIGMIRVAGEILRKPGGLSKDEWDMVHKHPEYGFEILKDSDSLILIAASIIALQHHERWDGMGYPNQLKGDSIHIFARIVALVDVFDILNTDTCYRSSWGMESISDHIKSERGKHFDPELVDLFLENLDDAVALKEQLLQS